MSESKETAPSFEDVCREFLANNNSTLKVLTRKNNKSENYREDMSYKDMSYKDIKKYFNIVDEESITLYSDQFKIGDKNIIDGSDICIKVYYNKNEEGKVTLSASWESKKYNLVRLNFNIQIENKKKFISGLEKEFNNKKEQIKAIIDYQENINKIVNSLKKTSNNNLFIVPNKKDGWLAPEIVREGESLPFIIKDGAQNGDIVESKLCSPDLHFAVKFTADKDDKKNAVIELEDKEGNPVTVGVDFKKNTIDISNYNGTDKENKDSIINNIFEKLNEGLENLTDSKETFLKEYITKNHNAKLETIKKLLLTNKNIILHGAPGTGKTWTARNEIPVELKILKKDDSDKDVIDTDRVCFIQFHPSYDYTDFIEGIKPQADQSFKRVNGIFKDFCKRAAEAAKAVENGKEPPKYLFIIDEINRGELSKIFGETFSLIEKSYRGGEHRKTTQYQNLIDDKKDVFYKGFYVPENVYIVGCMNDIDRSVEAIDFAMRRRFAWVNISADDSQIMFYTNPDFKIEKKESKTDEEKKEDEKKEKLREKSIQLMTNINNKIAEVFNPDYQLGGSYFLKLKQYEGDERKLWTNHISGVLKDYLVGVDDESNSKYHGFFSAYFRDSMEMSEDMKDKIADAARKLDNKFRPIGQNAG